MSNDRSRTRIRTASAADAEWINERYSAVHFLPSDLSRDLTVVAEVDGVTAGIGRLVPAGDRACELGGMLVFEEFRGRGIARSIINELLILSGDRTVYCIPFADLEPIYAAAGFTRIEASGELPAHIREKLDWCAREIERPVLLMKLAALSSQLAGKSARDLAPE